ncbi:MAG: succinate--CoA ligase subunit beta [Calothrix sp. MO_167.B12]|nr:succinate--CoA ligase subunit beta [Calothrix sp. MO_167.B12]
MNLLEYQVKEWFREMGIPVLPSQKIDHPTDLKRLQISYPIVLKSQVHGRDRAKAGGVRFVETTIDAIAAAQTIFNLPILGELPELLLAETKYEKVAEFYLAVVLDTAVCRPVLLGCQEADIDWESAGEKMQYVVVEQEFSPFYARRLALKMGLHGSYMQSVSRVIEKMYRLFVQKDLDLVEINPLAMNDRGQLMALNGSVIANPRALRRHPEIKGTQTRNFEQYPSIPLGSYVGKFNSSGRGKIAILGNGVGSVMATLDLVVNAGGKPGVCINLRHASMNDSAPTTFNKRLEQALNVLATDKSIKVILMNFLDSTSEATVLAEVIARFVENHRHEIQSQTLGPNSIKSRVAENIPYLVVRLVGSQLKEAQKYLIPLKASGEAPVLIENLDQAVAEAIRLTKSPANQKVK